MGARNHQGGTTNWAELVGRVTSGERDAAAELCDAALPLVRRAVRRVTTDADNEDAIQDAMILVLRNVHTIRHPERFPGWVSVLARRAAFRHIACRNRLRPMDLRDDPTVAGRRASDVDDLVDRLAATHVLHRAVDRLSPAQQRILWVLSASDAPYEDCAVELDCPVGTLGPTRARALSKLRRDPHVLELLDAS
jgi:RNA polymerase sigma factor (sigma-70 family)